MDLTELNLMLDLWVLDARTVSTEICSGMDHIPEVLPKRTHMTFNVHHCTLTHSTESIKCNVLEKMMCFKGLEDCLQVPYFFNPFARKGERCV